MRRTTLWVTTTILCFAAFSVMGGKTAAQTGPAPIQTSSQLQLPSSAFPNGFSDDGNEAWRLSDAEGSTFSTMHSKTYTALGMRGAWYQYYDEILTMTTGSVTYVSPLEVAYLGTYYADAASAANAYSDIQPSAELMNPTPCSYGTRCTTYTLVLNWNGVTYTGLARIVQEGNAVAEIHSDVLQSMSSLVSNDQFTSYVDSLSQAFVHTVDSLEPTNTPTSTMVPPTETPTSTLTPTSTPTATATIAPTVIPLSFAVRSVRAEKYGSKPDVHLRRPLLKQLKVGVKAYLSIYVLVRSSPVGSIGAATFRLTSAGRVMLQRTTPMTISSPGTATYRTTATFKPMKLGVYVFRGTVTINGTTKQRSVIIRVAR